ncbi:MAG: DedA family protein [Elusimicrobiota bacterium]|nr:DedA family protein [Elusimicrobiota bacterium]
MPQSGGRRRCLTGAEVSLITLLGTSFLASTIVPISSEVALFAVLKLDTGLFWPAICVATLGNTAGGLTTYLIGRYAGSKKPLTQLDRVRRYGSPLLVFAWLPVVGDALCLAAGWTRLNWAAVALFSGFGRFFRYWVVAQGALW